MSNPQESVQNMDKKIDSSKLTPEQKEKAKQGYAEWAKEKGNDAYESWMPWIEDKYLSWFTTDNKTSYAAKEQLDKTKFTGIEQVDNLQDGANNLAAGQVGKGGLLQPVGDAVSKEGVNRAERGGKDEQGNSIPGSGAVSGVTEGAKSGAEGAGGYLGSAGSGIADGAKGVGGYVGGMLGGGKKEQDEQ